MPNQVYFVGYLILAFAVVVGFALLIKLFSYVSVLSEKIKNIEKNGRKSGKPELGGPEIGSLLPRIKSTESNHKLIEIGEKPGKTTIILFVTLTCQACKNIIPYLKYYSLPESVDIITLCRGENLEDLYNIAQRYEREVVESGADFLISSEIVGEIGIRAFPSYLVIDEDGTVIEKEILASLNVFEKYGIKEKAKAVVV